MNNQDKGIINLKNNIINKIIILIVNLFTEEQFIKLLMVACIDQKIVCFHQDVRVLSILLKK